MTGTLLPAEFADLEPYASTWCLPTEPQRWQRRLDSTMEEMQDFYDACFPRAADAITYCDQYPLTDLPDDARHLFHLLCSLTLVSYPVEVWRQILPIDTGSARIDRLAEPRL